MDKRSPAIDEIFAHELEILVSDYTIRDDDARSIIRSKRTPVPCCSKGERNFNFSQRVIRIPSTIPFRR